LRGGNPKNFGPRQGKEDEKKKTIESKIEEEACDIVLKREKGGADKAQKKKIRGRGGQKEDIERQMKKGPQGRE